MQRFLIPLLPITALRLTSEQTQIIKQPDEIGRRVAGDILPLTFSGSSVLFTKQGMKKEAPFVCAPLLFLRFQIRTSLRIQFS